MDNVILEFITTFGHADVSQLEVNDQTTLHSESATEKWCADDPRTDRLAICCFIFDIDPTVGSGSQLHCHAFSVSSPLH